MSIRTVRVTHLVTHSSVTHSNVCNSYYTLFFACVAVCNRVTQPNVYYTLYYTLCMFAVLARLATIVWRSYYRVCIVLYGVITSEGVETTKASAIVQPPPGRLRLNSALQQPLRIQPLSSRSCATATRSTSSRRVRGLGEESD